MLAAACLPSSFWVSKEVFAEAISSPRTSAEVVAINPIPSFTTSFESWLRWCSGSAAPMNSPSSALPNTHANTIDPIANALTTISRPKRNRRTPSTRPPPPVRSRLAVAVLFSSCLLDRDGKRLGVGDVDDVPDLNRVELARVLHLDDRGLPLRTPQGGLGVRLVDGSDRHPDADGVGHASGRLRAERCTAHVAARGGAGLRLAGLAHLVGDRLPVRHPQHVTLLHLREVPNLRAGDDGEFLTVGVLQGDVAGLQVHVHHRCGGGQRLRPGFRLLRGATGEHAGTECDGNRPALHVPSPLYRQARLSESPP